MSKIVAVYILCGILLLTGLLLFLPLNIRFTYREGISLSVSVLFIKFTYPQKDPKKKKNKNKKKEKTAKKGKKGAVSSLSVGDYLSLLKILFEKFIKKLRVKRLFIDVSVGGLDAAKTAILYGSVNGAAYALVGAVTKNGPIKELNIDVKADFLAEKTEATVDVIVFARIHKIIPLLKELLKYLRKGGNNNE